MAHEEVEIKAEKRTVKGKQVGAIRRAGLLPGVIYGRHLNAFPIQMDYRDAATKINHLTSSSLVTIDVAGEKHTAIVRDRQKDVIKGDLLHVDFLAVSLTETLRTTVRVELVGKAPVSETFEVVIVQSTNELDIECLPQYLPETVKVDLGILKSTDDVIYVRDLDLGDKVTVHTHGDDVVASVTFVAQEVEEVTTAEEGAEPEIMEKGKKEEEEAE